MTREEIEPFKHIKKVYFELIDGQFINESSYNFYTGCRFMRMEIHGFNYGELDDIKIDENTIVFGGVGTMLDVFKKINIDVPKPLDIPEELNSFTKRNIQHSTIQNVLNDDSFKYPIFIKPSDSAKLFNGSIVESKFEMETFLVYNKTENRDIPITVSEVKKFLSEYRTFVLDGKILDCRKYLGDFHYVPDFSLIENAIKNYVNAPVAYAIDFAVTDKGETVLIEVNDSYSLGTYGLDCYDYFRMIMMRWLEITKK